MLKVTVAGKTYDAGSQEHLDAVAAELARVTAETAKEKARADAAEMQIKRAEKRNLIELARNAGKIAARRDHRNDAAAFTVAHANASRYLSDAAEAEATPNDAIIEAALAHLAPGFDPSALSSEAKMGALLALSAQMGGGGSAPVEIDTVDEPAIEATDALPDQPGTANAVPAEEKIPGYDSKNSIRPRIGEPNRVTKEREDAKTQTPEEAQAEKDRQYRDAKPWLVGRHPLSNGVSKR